MASSWRVAMHTPRPRVASDRFSMVAGCPLCPRWRPNRRRTDPQSFGGQALCRAGPGSRRNNFCQRLAPGCPHIILYVCKVQWPRLPAEGRRFGIFRREEMRNDDRGARHSCCDARWNAPCAGRVSPGRDGQISGALCVFAAQQGHSRSRYRRRAAAAAGTCAALVRSDRGRQHPALHCQRICACHRTAARFGEIRGSCTVTRTQITTI